MKKLLFLILIIFLFSCEKEKISCYKCTTTAKNFTSVIITECELTAEEALQLERGLQIHASMLTDSIAMTICEPVICSKFNNEQQAVIEKKDSSYLNNKCGCL